MWANTKLNDEKTMATYISKDPDKAVKNLKNVMSAMKYLQDQTINSRLKAAKERVAARLKELDEVEWPKWQRKTADKNWAKWKPIGLEKEWTKFIKQQATTASDKAVKYLDNYCKKLMDNYKNNSNEQLAEMDTDAGKSMKTLLEKIKKVDEEWKQYKPNSWKNPF